MKILQFLQKLYQSVVRDTEPARGMTNDRGMTIDSFQEKAVATRPARHRTLPMMLATDFDALAQAKTRELNTECIRDRINKMQEKNSYLQPRQDEDFLNSANKDTACAMAKSLPGTGYPLVLRDDVDLKCAHRALLYAEVALRYDYEDQEARKIWGIASVVELLVADGERSPSA